MNSIKNTSKHLLKNLYNDIRYNKFIRITDRNIEGIAADVIRLTHSIEKGLTLNNVKLGYGHQKQRELLKKVSKLEHYDSGYCVSAIKMAVNAIDSYLNYHKKKNYRDDFFIILENFISDHKSYLQSNYGGVIELKKDDLVFNKAEIEKFFLTRHSIRDFDDKPVDANLIKKAVKLAQTSPSACNRQGYRCYVIDKAKADILKEWLSGIGGFADKLDKILLITGKTSAYRYNENYQYIVSASIFAAYLSLTLHLYGIGSCIIQRSVVWTKRWNYIRNIFNINEDEQIILCIGVGMLKNKTMVPISHRFDTDEIYRFVK